MLAHEQRAAEKVFQLRDLPAHPALRQMQFGGGFGETGMPYRRFERDEALERR
jgi:hypothetical protein